MSDSNSQNKSIRLCDTALNILDISYIGKTKRGMNMDYLDVLTRAWNMGVDKIIITPGHASELIPVFKLSQLEKRLFCTIGVPPTRCKIFTDKTVNDLFPFLIRICRYGKEKKKVVALGEIGLDYDRLEFCEKEHQIKYFRKQLDVRKYVDLPLFLHERNCGNDLLDILNEVDPEHTYRGCVHSYTGTAEHAKEILNMGFYISFNGRGMQTEEGLEVVKSVPLNRILIESDGPYCQVLPKHASYKYVKTHFKYSKKYIRALDELKKTRNEPCCIIQLVEIIAALHDVSVQEAGDIIYHNSLELFFPWELYYQRRVEEISSQVKGIASNVDKTNFRSYCDTLIQVRAEIENDLSSKIEKMYQKASSSDPESRGFGPETCEKIIAWYPAFISMKSLVEEATVKCTIIQNEVTEALVKEAEERKMERKRRDEEEIRRHEEEELERQMEAMRLEQERVRQQKQEEERIAKEAAARAAEAALETSRQAAKQQLETEEKERRRQQILEKQKALVDTLRMKREAEKKAAEEKARQTAEANRLCDEMEARAAEDRWMKELENEHSELEHVDLCLTETIHAVEGIKIWELSSGSELKNIITNTAIPYLCIFWHSEFIPSSRQLLESITSLISVYPSIRFLVINTTTYPQLQFQNGVKQLPAVTCYDGNQQISISSSADTVMNTVKCFYETVENRRTMLYLNLFEQKDEKSSGFCKSTVVDLESFGMVTITDMMKKQLSDDIDTLKRACEDLFAFKQAIDIWTLILQNIISNPLNEKFCRIRASNEKIRSRLTGRKGGEEGLLISGFKKETINDIEYYIMKSGNLNIPWISVILDALKSSDFAPRIASTPFQSRPRRQPSKQSNVQSSQPSYGSSGVSTIDPELQMYYRNMSATELQMEMSGVMFELQQDPEVAAVFMYINEHPNLQQYMNSSPDPYNVPPEMMEMMENPSLINGMKKIQDNPILAFLTMCYQQKMG